jgi:hypothetical protein
VGVEFSGFCLHWGPGNGHTRKNWLVKKEQRVERGRMDAECPVWKGPFGCKTPYFACFFDVLSFLHPTHRAIKLRNEWDTLDLQGKAA